jgi:hypothetical protein
MANRAALKTMLAKAAPPIRPSNLVSKLRRIRWELSLAQDRSGDVWVASEMGILVRQTDEAIEKIEGRHRERS